MSQPLTLLALAGFLIAPGLAYGALPSPFALAPSTLAPPTLAPAAVQDKAPSPDLPVAEQIERYLDHARKGSAFIRPQAASRLVKLGEPAAARLLEVSGESTDQLALLGTNLVEIFGAFDGTESGPRLRAKLWPALEDSEFPWRPAAVRGLSKDPVPDERERFIRYLDDPIPPVRLAALDALYTLTVDADAKLRARYLDLAFQRLSHDNDIVRREAALQLYERGHGNALFWLLEDLKREDSFFSNQTGKMARYDGMKALVRREIDLGTYNPELPPDSTVNKPGLRRIDKTMRGIAKEMNKALPESERDLLAEGPPLIAQAAPAITDAVLGLQLQSCRRGDYFLRWTTGDVLVIGYGNPARVQLASGTTEALIKASQEAQVTLGDKVFWGRAGCDMESYVMPMTVGEETRPQQLIVANNEEKLEGLRPGALTGFAGTLAASIPSDEELESADPRTRNLAAQVRAAFASIGGPVPESGQ